MQGGGLGNRGCPQRRENSVCSRTTLAETQEALRRTQERLHRWKRGPLLHCQIKDCHWNFFLGGSREPLKGTELGVEPKDSELVSVHSLPCSFTLLGWALGILTPGKTWPLTSDSQGLAGSALHA